MVYYRKIQLIALISLPAYLLSSCENDLEKVNLVAAQKKYPVEKAENAEILYSDSALLKARLLATELMRFQDQPPYLEMPKGVKLYFYDDNGKASSQLSAGYGKVIQLPDNNIMEARRNVVVVNERNEKLNTEHLTWNQKEGNIKSDAYVKITTADEVLMGEGLESNQDFTKYSIKKLKGTIRLKN